MTLKSTIVLFLLDESGSMESSKDHVIDGYNEYISALVKDYKDHPELGEYLFTLTTFSSDIRQDKKIRTPHNLLSIEDVPTMTSGDYTPNGGTPLYDAIAESINSLNSQFSLAEAEALSTDEPKNPLQKLLKKMDARPVDPKEIEYKVLCVIQTDGMNNSSTTTKAEAKNLIESMEKQGNWTFVFLGAGLAAMSESLSLGMAAGSSYQYSPDSVGIRARHGSRVAVSHLAEGTSRLRGSSAMSVNKVDGFYTSADMVSMDAAVEKLVAEDNKSIKEMPSLKRRKKR